MSAIIVVIFVIKLIPVKAPPIGAVAIEMNRKLKPLGPYSVDTHLFFFWFLFSPISIYRENRLYQEGRLKRDKVQSFTPVAVASSFVAEPLFHGRSSCKCMHSIRELSK